MENNDKYADLIRECKEQNLSENAINSIIALRENAESFDTYETVDDFMAFLKA